MASETEATATEMTTHLIRKILREGGHQTVHKQPIDESRPRQPCEGAGGPTESNSYTTLFTVQLMGSTSALDLTRAIMTSLYQVTPGHHLL